jgi:hypothetical protein
MELHTASKFAIESPITQTQTQYTTNFQFIFQDKFNWFIYIGHQT